MKVISEKTKYRKHKLFRPTQNPNHKFTRIHSTTDTLATGHFNNRIGLYSNKEH